MYQALVHRPTHYPVHSCTTPCTTHWSMHLAHVLAHEPHTSLCTMHWSIHHISMHHALTHAPAHAPLALSSTLVGLSYWTIHNSRRETPFHPHFPDAKTQVKWYLQGPMINSWQRQDLSLGSLAPEFLIPLSQDFPVIFAFWDNPVLFLRVSTDVANDSPVMFWLTILPLQACFIIWKVGVLSPF